MGIFDLKKRADKPFIEKKVMEKELMEAFQNKDYKFVYKHFDSFKNLKVSDDPEDKVWFIIVMVSEFCKENDAAAVLELCKYGIDYMNEYDLLNRMDSPDGLNCMMEFINQTVIAAYTLEKYDECLRFYDYFCHGNVVPQTLGHAIVLMSLYELQENRDVQFHNFTELGQELLDVFNYEDFLTRLQKKSKNECVIAFFDVPRTLSAMFLKLQTLFVVQSDDPNFPITLSLKVYAKAKEKLTENIPGYREIRKMIDDTVDVLKSGLV